MDKGKGKKRSVGNRSKGNDGHSTEKGDGPINKEGYCLYGTCNKRYNGIYRKFKRRDRQQPQGKKWTSRTETKGYIKTMVSKKKGKSKQRRNYDSSDSYFSSDEELSRNGLS